MGDFAQVQEAADAIRARVSEVPAVAIVLGSGLGDFADSLGGAVTMPYASLPHWPASRVIGHAGKLVVGKTGGRTIAALAGRCHLYEGHDPGRVAFEFTEDVPISLGPKLWDGKEEKQLIGLTLSLPAGTNAGALGDFQHKQFVNDLLAAKLRPAALQEKLGKSLGDAEAKKVVDELQSLSTEVIKDPQQLITAVKKRPMLLEVYSSCLADVENDGHPFGEGLSDKEKKALIAFLATL